MRQMSFAKLNVEGERGQFAGENSVCTNITNKTFDEKMLLISSLCLTVSSITFISCNNPILTIVFTSVNQVHQLINSPMGKITT